MDEDRELGGPSGGLPADGKGSTNAWRPRWASMPPKNLEFHAASNDSCTVVTRKVVRTTVDGKEQVEDHSSSVDVRTDGAFGGLFDAELDGPRRQIGRLRKELEHTMLKRSSFSSSDVKDYGDGEQEMTSSFTVRRGVNRHTFHSRAVKKKGVDSSGSLKYSRNSRGDNASPASGGGSCGDAGGSTGDGGGGGGGVSAESLVTPRDRIFMSHLNERLGFGEKLWSHSPVHWPSSSSSVDPATVTPADDAEANDADADDADADDSDADDAGTGERAHRPECSSGAGVEEKPGEKRGSPARDGARRLSGLRPLLGAGGGAAIAIPRLRLMMDSEFLYQEYRTETIVQTLLRQRCHDGEGDSELHGHFQQLVASITLDDNNSSIGSGSSGRSSPPARQPFLELQDSATGPLELPRQRLNGAAPAICAAPVHPGPSLDTPGPPEKGPVFEFWHTLPEVQSSHLLSTMTQEQIKLQEAMFELITSEASYLRSLRVATEVFIDNPDVNEVLSSSQRHFVFSNLQEVKAVSERMLAELEERLGQSVEISDVCDIVYNHAAKNFRCYVKYITNQPYQERALRTLSNETPQFSQILNRLISEPRCKNLPLSSFLLLPFQRITRLKLLVENILKRTEKGTQRHQNAQRACKQLEMCIMECNDGILKMSRTEELIHIEKTLEFKDKSVPIISHSRWLYKQGELMEMHQAQSMTLRSSKVSFKPLYLFLFTDLLLFARKKDAGARFLVFEHAELTAVSVSEQQPIQNHRHLVHLKVNLDNRKRRKAFILKAQSENEQKRWVTAINPKRNKTPSKAYGFYADCEQVCCIKPYKAQEADEMTLDFADSFFILRKTTDGWYEGERMSDRQRGWFPSRVVEPVASGSVREENVRERECLLTSVEGGGGSDGGDDGGDGGGDGGGCSYGVPTIV